jgi:hypothetical protein
LTLRFEIGYVLTDLDIFTDPKPGAFRAEPARVSEIDWTLQVAHAAFSVSVKLPKRLYFMLDAGIDVGKTGNAKNPEGIGAAGYNIFVGLGYTFR